LIVYNLITELTFKDFFAYFAFVYFPHTAIICFILFLILFAILKFLLSWKIPYKFISGYVATLFITFSISQSILYNLEQAFFHGVLILPPEFNGNITILKPVQSYLVLGTTLSMIVYIMIFVYGYFKLKKGILSSFMTDLFLFVDKAKVKFNL
jgi:hypothetical protein